MIDDWLPFGLAFGAFFATHALPVRPNVRAAIEGVMGKRGFGVAYSALSIAALFWLITAAARAPYIELWPVATWQAYIALFGMVVAVGIIAFSIGRPNPFSFGGRRNAAFDPARPGLVRWMRHPLLVALFVWSTVHMIANGDLAHVLVFGSFALFSVFGQFAIDRRKSRADRGNWQSTLDQVRAQRHEHAPFTKEETAWRGALAVSVFFVLVLVHPHLFGVSPLR